MQCKRACNRSKCHKLFLIFEFLIDWFLKSEPIQQQPNLSNKEFQQYPAIAYFITQATPIGKASIYHRYYKYILFYNIDDGDELFLWYG